VPRLADGDDVKMLVGDNAAQRRHLVVCRPSIHAAECTVGHHGRRCGQQVSTRTDYENTTGTLIVSKTVHNAYVLVLLISLILIYDNGYF